MLQMLQMSLSKKLRLDFISEFAEIEFASYILFILLSLIGRCSLPSWKQPAQRSKPYYRQRLAKDVKRTANYRIECRCYCNPSSRQKHVFLFSYYYISFNIIWFQGEKAIQHFNSLDIQQQLSRHLLKTSGSELVNELVSYVAQDTSVASDSKDMSFEVCNFCVCNCYLN